MKRCRLTRRKTWIGGRGIGFVTIPFLLRLAVQVVASDETSMIISDGFLPTVGR